SMADSINAQYLRRVATAFDLEQRSALLLAGTRQTVGLAYDRLVEVARRTDVLVNISGMLTDQELTGPIPYRIYLDLDPGCTQLWQAAQGIDMGFAGHSHVVTIGTRIGQLDCPVPTCGLDLLTTLQPIVLPYWPAADRS